MTLILFAPMAGWVGSLHELPDAAFAEGMVGDGVAIDPIGSVLHAPCAGTVVSLHRALHALTLQADNGAQILCHIGIETVGLGGAGFTALVAEGDRVEAGAPLIRFDLETLAHGAKSLASPIVLLETGAFRVGRRAIDTRIAVGGWLMDLEETGAIPQDLPIVSDATAITREIRLPVGHGIHARPAAAIVALARGFEADVQLITERSRASATSAVALMTLGLAGGDTATLSVSGPDADAALNAIASLIEHGLEGNTPVPDGYAIRIQAGRAAQAAPRRGGVTAAPGIAVGTIVLFDAAQRDPPSSGQGLSTETWLLETAIAAVRAAIAQRTSSGPAEQRAIARAHLALLDDARLLEAAMTALSEGASAGAAWRTALAPDIAALRAVVDVRISSRADDLVDLEQQVITAILGPADTSLEFPEDSILVAQDLLPSQLMAIDPARLAGVALAGGGPTSHVAIIAGARGIPMVVALGIEALAHPNGSRVVLDADAATLIAADSASEADAMARIVAAKERHATARAAANEHCHLADGTRIEVFANLGGLADADAAMRAGAEGCGLLRTELLFLDRDTPPSEAEQLGVYESIAKRLGGRPLIIRTLDVGGDKPVRYLPIAPEDNPALGLRGIRVGLHHPELLAVQLRAILRVAPPGQCSILVPMIASLDELLEVRHLVDAAARAIGRVEPVRVGVMIETPAAAIAADLLAEAADFFAIGTNDLAQYTLAMDRGNPLVAPQVDALHPAVLRMIDCAARAAAAQGRPVGVCGGLASDLVAAPILIGLGVTELSAVPGVIPELKALLRSLTRSDCASLSAKALCQPSASAVRALSVRI